MKEGEKELRKECEEEEDHGKEVELKEEEKEEEIEGEESNQQSVPISCSMTESLRKFIGMSHACFSEYNCVTKKYTFACILDKVNDSK